MYIKIFFKILKMTKAYNKIITTLTKRKTENMKMNS